MHPLVSILLGVWFAIAVVFVLIAASGGGVRDQARPALLALAIIWPIPVGALAGYALVTHIGMRIEGWVKS